MNLSRTDLTVETAEELSAGGRLFAPDSGVQLRESLRCGCPVTCIRVASPAGARAIGRPVGRYVTIDLRPCLARQEELTGRAAQCLAGELRALLPPLAARDTTLVVGMGNEAMTPDAVGAEALTHLLVTRHMVDAMPRRFGHLRSVAALRTGVLAQTGVETLELIRGAVSHIRPTVVIAVDALAARSATRLATTVQMTDTGVRPGSGIGQKRRELSRQTMGVPVIAIGVPTVASSATLVYDALEEAGAKANQKLTEILENGRNFFVSLNESDIVVNKMAHVISEAINRTLLGA